MGNRKDLLDRQNQIRNAYNSTKVQMEKAGATPEQIGQLNQSFKSKMSEAEMTFGDDLSALNRGDSIPVNNGTTTGVDLPQNKLPDVSKQVNLGKQSMFRNIAGKLGKKAAAVLPFAGVANAALSGDPAMAAEELASDAAGPVGMAYEAIKPEIAGNIDEERMMLAERDAMGDYNESPAARDSKFAKIKASLNKK